MSFAEFCVDPFNFKQGGTGERKRVAPCLCTGRVGHASVHSYSGPVLGDPEVVRVVLKQHQHRSWPFTRFWIDAMLRLLLLLNTTRTRSGHTYML